MTCYIDFVGTDNFYEYYSNPSSKLDAERDYFVNNIWNQINLDSTVTTWSDQVEVSDTNDRICLSSDDRLDEAEDWLSSYFSVYSSSNAIVVLDHYGGDYGYLGCAGGNHVDGDSDKACLVDYYNENNSNTLPAYDLNGMGVRHYLGMEPGHLFKADHPDDAYVYSNGDATMMFDDDGAQCGNYATVQKVVSSFSTCADDVIERTGSNNC